VHEQYLTVKIFVGELFGNASKGYSFIEISERLDVSISTVYRIYKLFKESNAIHPKLRCKARPHTRKIDMGLELYAIGYVLEYPGIYLDEACHIIQNSLGVLVSTSTVCRLLKRHGFTHKLHSINLHY